MAQRPAPTKAKPVEKIPRWQVHVDYVESCNCAFACSCNFTGYPTDGYCEALVGYHIRNGRFGRTKLDGLDVISAGVWPRVIPEGGGWFWFYISAPVIVEQRDALIRIFAGRAKNSGPFALFANT